MTRRSGAARSVSSQSLRRDASEITSRRRSTKSELEGNSSHPVDILIVGVGIFGATAAIELRKRNYRIALLDPGPLPHDLAASTDIRKVLRMEYGPDGTYMDCMQLAFEGWRSWNEEWIARGIGPLYHRTGVLMITRDEMRAGGYEYESFQRLSRRGLAAERLDAEAIENRFPAWKQGRHVDGFFHSLGGWAESGEVVKTLRGPGRGRDQSTLTSILRPRSYPART